MRFKLLGIAGLLVLMLTPAVGCGGSNQMGQQQEEEPQTVVVTREVTEEVTTPPEETTPPAEETSPPEEAEPTESTEDPQPSDELLRVGETAADGGVEVTLLEAYRTDGDPSFDLEYLDEGETYVVLDVTYLNESEATYYISTADWTAYNGDGYSQEFAYPSTLGSAPGFDGDLRPGNRRSGPVAFVAPESDELTVEFELYGVGYAVWDLGSVGGLPEQAAASSEPLSEDPGASDPTGSEEASIQEFVSDYYAAVADQDWSATYSFLDSATQAVFTEEEWLEVQEAREAAQDLPTINYVTVEDYSGDGEVYEANVTRAYEGGTSDNLDIVLRVEDGEIKRSLTEEEIAILRDFQG